MKQLMHLRIAIFGLQKAGWSVAPALYQEMGRIHDRIMAPVREARCNAARVGDMTRSRQIAGNQWLYDKQREGETPPLGG